MFAVIIFAILRFSRIFITVQKEKILIIIHSLLRGGAEHVFAQIINQLNNRFEIHVILVHNGIAYSLPSNVAVTGLREKLFENFLISYCRLPYSAYKVYRYCKKHQITTRISVLNRPTIINAFLKYFFRLEGKVIVCERSNQAQFIEFLSRGNKLKSSIYKKVIVSAYRQADLILANSKLTAAGIKDAFQITNEVQVIYNPVDITGINDKAGQVPDFEFERGITYFIGVGVMRAEKNWALLVKAIALLDNPAIKLILVGYGSEKELNKLNALVAELGVQNKIVFTGMQPNPYQYMARAHCLVLCSMLEGFPNVVLESLALGVPVISTDCRSGPREILAPGTDPEIEVTNSLELAEFGILYPVNSDMLLAEAMHKMYTDKSLHSSYTQKAKQRAADFEAARISGEYGDVFSQVKN